MLKFLDKKILLLLLAIFITAGCADQYEDPFHLLPKQGTFINDRFKIGDKFPEFTANDSLGNSCLIDQSKYGDRYTMVIFWKSESGVYERRIPEFAKLFEKYRAMGFDIISVKGDCTSEKSQATASKPSVAWTSLYADPGKQLQKELGLKIWPSIFILNNQGTIISSHFSLNSIYQITDPWSGDPQNFHSFDLTMEYLFRKRY